MRESRLIAYYKNRLAPFRGIFLGLLMSRSVLASLLASGVVLAAAHASAMELVSGGYGANVESYVPSSSLALQSRSYSSSASAAGLTLDFTPRASGMLFSRPAAESGTPDVSVSFDFKNAYERQLRFDSIGLSTPSAASDQALALGGALSIEDWRVSGSVGRVSLLGNDADVVAAGLGYGPLNARLVYGSVPETAGGTEGDLLMFSTDLAAWSWLTLQGDVAVSDTLADEPLTVGRIGIRLNF